MQTDPLHPPGCLLVVSATPPPEDAVGSQSILAKDRASTRRGFAACIQRAVEAKELPDTFDVEAGALMLDTFMRGLTTQVRDGVSFAQLESAIGCAMRWWKPSRRSARKAIH